MIYVMHDDPVVTQTMLEFLSELGYSAAPVDSGRELLAALEAGRPRADVLVAKPGLAGMQQLREMHERYPETAVILITSATASLSASDAVACGVYAYLRQPIRLSELELLMARLTEGRLIQR